MDEGANPSAKYAIGCPEKFLSVENGCTFTCGRHIWREANKSITHRPIKAL